MKEQITESQWLELAVRYLKGKVEEKVFRRIDDQYRPKKEKDGKQTIH